MKLALRHIPLFFQYAGYIGAGIGAIYGGGNWYKSKLQAEFIQDQKKKVFIDSTRIANQAVISLQKDYFAFSEAMLAMQDGLKTFKNQIDTVAKHVYKIERQQSKSEKEPPMWYYQMFNYNDSIKKEKKFRFKKFIFAHFTYCLTYLLLLLLFVCLVFIRLNHR